MEKKGYSIYNTIFIIFVFVMLGACVAGLVFFTKYNAMTKEGFVFSALSGLAAGVLGAFYARVKANVYYGKVLNEKARVVQDKANAEMNVIKKPEVSTAKTTVKEQVVEPIVDSNLNKESINLDTLKEEVRQSINPTVDKIDEVKTTNIDPVIEKAFKTQKQTEPANEENDLYIKKRREMLEARRKGSKI